jgi:hypothetical protein
MPWEVPLTSRAAERLAREASTQKFDRAASALTIDWGLPLDGKQIQRWSEKLGQRVVAERQLEVAAYERGHRPPCPVNDPLLLVIGMDGGRVQMREKNAETGSRWREDKVGTVTSYFPGDGTEEHPPRPLVTTYVGTMAKTEGFGKLVQIEAERRGLRGAGTVVVLGDGGNWIDPLTHRERLCDQRILDFYHAAEHLYEAAEAIWPKDRQKAKALGTRWKTWVWDGQVDRVIAELGQHAERLGRPQKRDGPEHPRRVVANNRAYFAKHRLHMDYPRYRGKGWPVGSGVTESGVKQFNKRVKGTDQFWTEDGVESILALRAMWLSQDDRWTRYWNSRPAYPKAA